MEGTIDQNRLIALLLEEKLINKRQVKDALSEQEKTRKSFPQVLLDLKLVTPGVLSELQAKVMGMEHIRVGDLQLDEKILKLLSKRYATEHRAVPISLSGNVLTVAMENPKDVLAIDEIKLLTGFNVRAVISSAKDIELGLAQYPVDEGKAAIAGPQISKMRDFIQFSIFILLLILPFGIIALVATKSNEFNSWMLGNSGDANTDLTNIITILIIWIFYALVLFYVYGLFFEPRKPAENRKPENE
jgi:hypothetical protein